jgi:hypothetical protein
MLVYTALALAMVVIVETYPNLDLTALALLLNKKYEPKNN